MPNVWVSVPMEFLTAKGIRERRGSIFRWSHLNFLKLWLFWKQCHASQKELNAGSEDPGPKPVLFCTLPGWHWTDLSASKVFIPSDLWKRDHHLVSLSICMVVGVSNKTTNVKVLCKLSGSMGVSYFHLCRAFFFFFFWLKTLIQSRRCSLISYLQLFVVPALGS